MASEPLRVVFYPPLHVPCQFRQCATCFKLEYETRIPLRTCSRCRVTHYCDEACQRNGFPSHKEPCLRRRNAIRRKDRDSLDIKWRPHGRAGGEGASLIPFVDLQRAFISWTKKNMRILAWAQYQASGMRRSNVAGFRNCLHVKLSGHQDTSDGLLRFKVASVDTVLAVDIARKFGGPFGKIRFMQDIRVDGIRVLAVLLECGPVVFFMPIGAPSGLVETWADDSEWKTVFLRGVVDP